MDLPNLNTTDIPNWILEVLTDYLHGNVDTGRDEMVRKLPDREKRGVLEFARKKLLPTKK